jgi:hypothetical protein
MFVGAMIWLFLINPDVSVVDHADQNVPRASPL